MADHRQSQITRRELLRGAAAGAVAVGLGGRLIVVDALRPLANGGPQVDPRYLWDYQGLLVGTDPVAVDTIGLEIIRGRTWEWRRRSTAWA